MAGVLRTVAAIVAASVVALVLVIAVEMFGAVVHPPPADLTGTQEEMCAHVARFPAWVLAVVVPMWGGIALLSTWLAGRIGNRGSAVFIGVLLAAAVVFNLAMLPYPVWFKIVQTLAVAAAVVVGCRWSRRRAKVITQPMMPAA